MRLYISLTDKEYEDIKTLAGLIPMSKFVKNKIFRYEKSLEQRELNIQQPREVESSCPFVGWEIVPNPDGLREPYYSDYHSCTMVEIMNPAKPFLKHEIIKKGEEWYDYFVKQ